MSIELFDPLTKPTAAQLNAIGASQTALDAAYPGVTTAPGAEEWSGSGQVWGILHAYRWLLYNGTGTLVDPSGANEDTSLSDAEPGQIAMLDLNTVAWLTTGMYYRVTGVDVVWESRTPPYA